MICWHCKADEKFESVKTNPERELLVCKECGSAMYRVEPDAEAKIKEYYRKEYRPAPTHMNLITTTHKLMYIHKFLDEFLKDKKGLVCCDVGAATGYFVNYLRRRGHRATGTEMTLTFRRFSEHYYGIPLTEEIDVNRKHDLISLYHVFEHMPEPDKKLAMYRDCLKDDGHLFLACPEWFKYLECPSGQEIGDYCNLFHKDHINVFSLEDMQDVIHNAGFEIVKQDRLMYGQTYLLKKCAIPETPQIRKKDPKATLEYLALAKKAIDLHKAGQFREAVDTVIKFPEAWILLIMNKNMKSPERQEDLWKDALEACGDSMRLVGTYATWLYQHQRFEEALKQYERVLQYKGGEDTYIFMGWCYENLGRHKECIQAMNKAIEINPMKWQEASNWMCKAASSLPSWDERAMEELMARTVDRMPKQALPKLLDPVMEDGNNKDK